MSKFSPIPFPPLDNSFDESMISNIKTIITDYNDSKKIEIQKKKFKPNNIILPLLRKKECTSVIKKKSKPNIKLNLENFSKCLECGEEVAFERQLCGKFYCKNNEFM